MDKRAMVTQYTGIHVWAELDPGISRDIRRAEARPVRFPATLAGAAMALDYAAREAAENCGAYGDIGAGRLYVVLVDNDGNRTPLCNVWEAVALPRGTLSNAFVRLLEDTVWNGHNHVRILPLNSYAIRRRTLPQPYEDFEIPHGSARRTGAAGPVYLAP